MNIKELEFIRDFSIYLEQFHEDLANLALSFEDKSILKDQDINYIWSIYRQSLLLSKIFNKNKSEIDKKYWSEWKKNYPHVNDDYGKHNVLVR